MSLKRNIESINWVTEDLKRMGVPYTIKQGTYSTTIESEFGKHKFHTNDYPKRVFVAANMIKKDVKNSKIAKEIMNTKHQKVNYGANDKHFIINEHKVLNIDLSGAYVHALKHTGIITDRTYRYLMDLGKIERLPAIGMLATSHVVMKYENGKCVGFKSHRSETSEIFFHLIDEVNYLMRDIEYMLGDDYIFHWVDGVFFKYETDNAKIENVENFLKELDYPFHYEKVDQFKCHKDDDVVRIEMIKNNKHKRYEFSTGMAGRNLTQILLQKAQANYA